MFKHRQGNITADRASGCVTGQNTLPTLDLGCADIICVKTKNIIIIDLIKQMMCSNMAQLHVYITDDTWATTQCHRPEYTANAGSGMC